MTRLSVNVNKIATLRNTRPLNVPDVVRFAALALDAGAAGITVHPRPDARHVRSADVFSLAKLLQRYPGSEFNIEGNPFHGFMNFAEDVRPTQCTLVPDEVDTPTSNQGWDLRPEAMDQLRPVVERLHKVGCRVSLFVDPDPGQAGRAAELGVDRVELYTQPYAEAFAHGDQTAANKYAATAAVAHARGLGVNAGHDLNLANLAALVAAIPSLDEVSIGHALVADALEFGMAETVRKYLAACAGR